jgi:hypothetical protein
MSAIAALEAARAAGVRLKIEGDDLVLEASAAPPSVVLDLLSRNKAGIATILRPGLSGWSVEDWHAFFAERAGTAEFDGALPRPQAEERAFTCCVVEWLNRSAVSSMPGRCIGCGGIHNARDPLLPYGVETPGHVWLHARCWPSWHEARKAQAVVILSSIGIALPKMSVPDIEFGAHCCER